MLDVGTANELKMAFRRAGYDSTDIAKLCAGNMAAKILPVLRGKGVVHIEKHVVDLACDCVAELWKAGKWVIEKHDVGNGILELDPMMFKLYLSDKQKNNKVMKGDVLRTELEENKIPVLNACVLEYLLLHQELIPEEWKRVGAICFWGTIYCDKHGCLHVRSLYWDGGVWRGYSHKLADDWFEKCPAAIFESVTRS